MPLSLLHATPELRDLIDREFYILSEAHYERYMLSPDLFRKSAE